MNVKEMNKEGCYYYEIISDKEFLYLQKYFLGQNDSWYVTSLRKSRITDIDYDSDSDKVIIYKDNGEKTIINAVKSRNTAKEIFEKILEELEKKIIEREKTWSEKNKQGEKRFYDYLKTLEEKR